MQIQKRPRPLLPAASRQDPAPHGDEARPNPCGGDAGRPPLKRKRIHVRVACNYCRNKKVACDGNRPMCDACRKANVNCQYISTTAEETFTMVRNQQIEKLQKDLRDYKKIIEQLKHAPENEALTIVRQLKSTSDLSAALSSINGAISPKRLSEFKTIRSILPPTESSIEVELLIQHNLMYLPLPPLDVTSLDINSLIYRHSHQPLPETSCSPKVRNEEASAGPDRFKGLIDPKLTILGTPAPFRGMPEKRSSTILGPLPPYSYCDKRLNDLNIEYWTTIPISNEFAASTISIYLENEHPMLGTFDVDLVLRDLTEYRLEHCSSFLVNALLCISCQCYAKFDSRASAFSLAFCTEAEKLWQSERTSDSVTWLAATNLLAIASQWLGLDAKSRIFLADVRQMGLRLNLFGVSYTPEIVDGFRQSSPDIIRATAYAAWGAYCWLSIQGNYFRGNPIAFPPALPIPGDGRSRGEDTESTSSWPIHTIPLYMGQTFAALCKYWSIAQDVQAFYFTHSDVPLQNAMPLSFAEEKYQKLMAWADTLDSADLGRKENTAGHVWIFHSLYHTVILDIFRPLLQRNLRMKSFTSSDSTPDAVFNASVRQIQRLIVEYMCSQDPKLYSPFLNAAIIHVTGPIIRGREDPNWRSYFLLHMVYWKELVVRHPVMCKLAQAFLSIGMSEGRIGGAEAQALLFDLQQRARHHEIAEAAIDCIVDFECAMSAKGGGRAEELAQKFDELAIFEELTTGDYSPKDDVKCWEAEDGDRTS